MRSSRLFRIAALVFAVTAGCGESGATDPYREIAGAFILHSIDGKVIPATIEETREGAVDITSGSLMLASDRSFAETWTFRLRPASGPEQTGTLSESGTFAVRGDSIEFSVPARPGRAALTVPGAIRSDTLTYTVDGRVVVYLD